MRRSTAAVFVTLSCVVLLSASCARDPEQLKRAYLASGDAYAAQKKFAEAIIEYRNALAQDPNFGAARFQLAAAYEATGELANALREYVRAADLLPDDANAQLQAGKMLSAAGQFTDARARAEAVLAKDPKNVNALLVMGNALAGLKDIDGAISQIDEAIEAEPRLSFSYTNLGVLQLENKNLAAAESAFKRAVALDPKSIPARLNLANYYWASEKRADAERELLGAAALDPKSPAANQALAAFYMMSGQRLRAEFYLKAYADNTANVDAKFLLADFYRSDGRTTEAARILEPLVQDEKGYGPAKLRLAVIDFNAGRREAAYQTLEEVLTRFPKSTQALETKIHFFASDRRYDEAIAIADSVLVDNPRTVRSRFLRGIALKRLGRVDEAIQSMQGVLEIVPASISAQIQLADLYLLKRDSRAALDLLSRIVRAQPQSAPAHLLLGQALLQSGNLARAEAEFLRIARANSSSSVIQTWLGRVYGAQGNNARARQAFSRALQLDPSSVLALNGLVSLDLVEGKREAARAKVEERLSASTDTNLLFLAGSTYMTLGDPQRAEALFQKVLAADPKHVEAYGRLGAIYWSQNRLEEARSKYVEAARQQAKPVAATTILGMLLQLQDKPAEARKQYEQALQLDPRAAVAANNLAWMYAENGENLDVALQLAQTAKAQLPDNAQASDTLGWVYYKKGLGSLAIGAFQEGVKQDLNNPVLHYHLGLAYLQIGDKAEARQSLQQALTLKPDFKGADEARRVLGTLKG